MKAIKPTKLRYNQKKWRPNCSVCQWMKRNKVYRERIFESTYFNPEGKVSPAKVNREYGEPFSKDLMYACLKKHHGHNVVRAPSKVVDGKVIVDNRFKQTFSVVENTGVTSNAELGLEELIAKGRTMLASGELRVTATTFVAAIGKRMDIDAKTKDRRADMLSGLFKGAAPKSDV